MCSYNWVLERTHWITKARIDTLRHRDGRAALLPAVQARLRIQALGGADATCSQDNNCVRKLELADSTCDFKI